MGAVEEAVMMVPSQLIEEVAKIRKLLKAP